MSKTNQKANQIENIQENVHKNKKWLAKARLNAEKKLTPKMFKLYCEYSDHLLLCSHSLSGRKKSLIQFVIIVNRFKIKDLKTITAEEIKQIVIRIMVENSSNGRETWYTQDLKKQVRFLVRFAKTGSHYLADEGELPELRQIKCRAIADKLSREEMPTEADCREILNACDSPMDRAMLAVHMEAGTRVGESHITILNNHYVIATGDEPISITASVGDEISIVLKITDNISVQSIPSAALYTNYQEKPSDMSAYYANNFDNLKQVSTSFYEWNVRSDDVAYDYDGTVSWSDNAQLL